MSEGLDLHVRVSATLDEDGVRLERHAFLNPGQCDLHAWAVCATHMAPTAHLLPDDPAVPLCQLCKVFL